MTAAELHKFISKNVTNPRLRQEADRLFRRLSPKRPFVCRKKKAGFEKMLVEHVEPIDAPAFRKRATKATNPEKRLIVVQALVGGMSQSQIRENVSSCSINSGAAPCIERAKSEQSLEPRLWFVGQAGKTGRRRKLE